MMKKYIAIGHWVGCKNITCVTSTNSSDKWFREDLKGNGFVPYVTFSEKKFESFKTMDLLEIFYEVKKLTSNYRRWCEVSEYICECAGFIEYRLNDNEQQ